METHSGRAEDRRVESRASVSETYGLEFKSGLFFLAKGRGSLRDISVRGARFSTSVRLKPKDKLLITFDFSGGKFPGKARVSVDAQVLTIYKVRGTDERRVCCRLRHATPETKAAIEEFVKWQQWLQKD